MLSRLISLVLIAGAAYWYWSGPYQASKNPSYEKRLEENELNMSRCMRGKAFAAGATGESEGDPEELCASKYNLYQHNDRWHSYDDSRPDD